MARSLGELAAKYGCELHGDPDTPISGVATLANAAAGQVSFFANRAYREQLRATGAAAVILQGGDVDDCPVAALVADNPYVVYARIAGEFHSEAGVEAGIHPSAVVSDTAEIHESVQISANATIADEAFVGAGSSVGAGAMIGPRCILGRGTRVQANVTLVQDVTIGDRCIIHPGVVIGADGFGFARAEEGWVKVPQIGGVRIGDDVEIGANTTIDRGAIDDTVIEEGVRLDNLIQIGHNARIGAHTVIVAQGGVAGSTVLGKRCMVGGQSGFVGHITVCDDVVVGGATMISKDIDKPGTYVGSFPAERDRDWKRKVARFRRMDELARQVSRLAKLVGKGK